MRFKSPPISLDSTAMAVTHITGSRELAAFCARVAGARYLAVDTEFMRESTYRPRLCLIQIAAADDGEAAVIDPLAPGMDLAPFQALMRDSGMLKIFHAARQDMEIFFQMMGALPVPIFDTQIAAGVCGYGDQIGYDALVQKTCGRRIDKSSRHSDWAKRPLKARQIDYAAADVTHLRDVYEKLHTTLEANGRSHWMAEEMALLSDPDTYEVDPDDAWRRLKFRNGKPRFVALLKELAGWREREARRLDRPRNWILRDDTLLGIAGAAPRTMDALMRVRGIQAGFAKDPKGQALLQAVKTGLEAPLEHTEPVAADPLSAEMLAVVDLMRVLLKACCAKAGVAGRMVATGDDLERIARDDNADTPALRGWRRDVFGAQALLLKQGRLALGADHHGVRVVSLDDQADAAGPGVMPRNE